jgi:hypothetical protein
VDNEGKPTERVDCAAKWLLARVKETSNSKEDVSLSRAVQEWLGADGIRLVHQLMNGNRLDRLRNLCRLMVTSALQRFGDMSEWPPRIKVRNPAAAIRQIKELDNPTESSYAAISRLLPPIHILVRSGWNEPLRWVFIPLTSALAQSEHSGSQMQPHLRVQSGIIAIFHDDVTGFPYLSNSDDVSHDSVLDIISKVLPLLAFSTTIEEELIRETLINSQEWLDTYSIEISQLQHTISAIQRHMAEASDNQHKPLRLLLKHLEAQFTTASPTGSLKREVVDVDVRDALNEAVESFNAYYDKYKLVTAEERCTVTERARVTLLYGAYSHENIDSLRLRGNLQLAILLLDILIQRYRAKGGLQKHVVLSCAVENEQYVVFRVWLDSPFDVPLEWDSRQESLDFFPRSRGFFATFSLARALGSVWQQVLTIDGKGQIVVAFPKAGDP